MRIKTIAIIAMFLAAFTGTGHKAFSQSRMPVRFFEQVRNESQLSYNFFTGADASGFSTSVNGFGSGIIDPFSSRTSVDMIQIGSDKFFLSLGTGFAIMKYRLSENLVFQKSGDQTLLWMKDPNPSHQYVNTFFGYGKSKIVTTSFYFPADINIGLGEHILLSAGGFLDLNLTARYKMKYLGDDDKVKEIIKSNEFRNLNLNTTKFGFNASVLHTKLGIGLSATYYLTPFFKDGMGPDIHEARISASFRIIRLKQGNGDQAD
jgi:hypothetical protein